MDRVVTNSPFLDWNYSPFMRKVAIPTVAALSRILPESKVTQSHCDGYGESLLKEYHGEWTYNTDWKMIYSPRSHSNGYAPSTMPTPSCRKAP